MYTRSSGDGNTAVNSNALKRPLHAFNTHLVFRSITCPLMVQIVIENKVQRGAVRNAEVQNAEAKMGVENTHV